MLALFLIGVIPLLLIIYARWNYGSLEGNGYPVIPPSFLLGSSPDLHKKVQHLEDVKRFQKYGKVYGSYEGRSPTVFICDPELIRLILVKDSEYFKDRREIDLGDEQVNEMMDFLPYDKWKEVRTPMTGFFTMGKMKLVSHSMKEAVEDFCGNLKKGDGLKVMMDKRFEALYLDMSVRASMGIKVDNHLSVKNEFLKTFREIAGKDAEMDFMYTLTMSFPFLTRFAPTLDSEAIRKIGSTFRGALKSRREHGVRNNDFADILNEMILKVGGDLYKKLGITENTIVAQTFNFILAGFDGMAIVSTMLCYYLAKYPDIQDKVRDELDNFLEENGEIIFDKMGDLVYLNACLYEAMRLSPPFIRPERICTKDWSNGKIKIKKGTMVMVPAWAVHRNPEEFPDPEEFKPERFLPENKKKINPYAFMTFGTGPRNCIGTRFAVEGMKFTMAHLLKEFRVELRHDSIIKYKPGVLFFVKYDEVPFNLVKR